MSYILLSLKLVLENKQHEINERVVTPSGVSHGTHMQKSCHTYSSQCNETVQWLQCNVATVSLKFTPIKRCRDYNATTLQIQCNDIAITVQQHCNNIATTEVHCNKTITCNETMQSVLCNNIAMTRVRCNETITWDESAIKHTYIYIYLLIYAYMHVIDICAEIWQIPLKLLHPRNPPHPETQIPRYKFKWNQDLNLNLYREIPRNLSFWIDGIWGRSIFSGKCHRWHGMTLQWNGQMCKSDVTRNETALWLHCNDIAIAMKRVHCNTTSRWNDVTMKRIRNICVYIHICDETVQEVHYNDIARSTLQRHCNETSALHRTLQWNECIASKRDTCNDITMKWVRDTCRSKETPLPGGVSYLICSLIKNRV